MTAVCHWCGCEHPAWQMLSFGWDEATGRYFYACPDSKACRARVLRREAAREAVAG